jgi:hypothetical protein
MTWLLLMDSLIHSTESRGSWPSESRRGGNDQNADQEKTNLQPEIDHGINPPGVRIPKPDGACWHMGYQDGGLRRRCRPVYFAGIDGLGFPHISYYEITGGNLEYARLVPNEIALAAELQAGQQLDVFGHRCGEHEYRSCPLQPRWRARLRV